MICGIVVPSLDIFLRIRFPSKFWNRDIASSTSSLLSLNWLNSIPEKQEKCFLWITLTVSSKKICTTFLPSKYALFAILVINVVLPTPNAARITPNSCFDNPPPIRLSIPTNPVGIGLLKSSAKTSSMAWKISTPSSFSVPTEIACLTSSSHSSYLSKSPPSNIFWIFWVAFLSSCCLQNLMATSCVCKQSLLSDSLTSLISSVADSLLISLLTSDLIILKIVS